MKCDEIIWLRNQNGDPWTTVKSSLRTLVTLSLVYSIGKKRVLCCGTVKLNKRSEMFKRVLAMGRHRWSTRKDTFVDVE